MPYRRRNCGFTPAAIENIRLRYENADEPLESIAADFDASSRTLTRLAKSQGWTLRKARPPRDLPPDLILLAEAEQAVRAEAAARDYSRSSRKKLMAATHASS